MAPRKKKMSDTIGNFHDEKFQKVDVDTNVNSNMLVYSEASIKRMIPDVRDGLIPVHRRILHTMNHDAKLSATSKHMKVAKVTGLVMGYHPHGDQSISSSLTLMSQPWRYYLPPTEVEGNKGSTKKTDDYSAPRYIECRLSPYAQMNMYGMNRNAVDMIPNYDNTAMEPTVFPAQVPQLMTNGSEGIATGFSTKIPPHNPIELLQAAELVNRRKRISVEELMEIVPAPDMPTGNTIMGLDGVKSMYETGVGKFVIRAAVEVEGDDIVITEMPFGVTRSSLIESITKAVVGDSVESQIKEIVDETVGDGEGTEDIRVVVSCEKKSNPDVIRDFLYKKTQVQINFSASMLSIVDGKPQVLNLKEYLEHFVAFRRDTVRRMYTFDVEKMTRRKHIVEGFITMIDIAEDVIKTIRAAQGKADAAQAISREFGFTEIQADAIVTMQLYRISNQDFQALKKEEEQLTKDIAHLEGILGDDKKFTSEISRLLKNTIKELGDMPRRSVVSGDNPDVKVDTTSLIENQDVVVVVTPDGVQRMSKQVYDNNVESATGDMVGAYIASTAQGMAVLTQQGLVMQRVVHEIPIQSIKQSPDDMRKTTSAFTSKDKIIAALPFNLDTLGSEYSVISVTSLGQVKHSPLDKSFLSFSQKGYLTRAKPYNGVKLDGDRVIYTAVVPRDNVDDVVFNVKRRSGGRVTTVNMKDYREQGATGSGVNVVKVTKPGDSIIVSKTNADQWDILQKVTI